MLRFGNMASRVSRMAVYCLAASWLFLHAVAVGAEESELSQWLTHLENRLPATVEDCTDTRAQNAAEAADAVEKWAAHVALFRGLTRPEQVFAPTTELLAAQQRVDLMLDELLRLRTAFATAKDEAPAGEGEAPAEPKGTARRDAIRCYLRITAGMIDLAGRIRLQLRDALDSAAYRVASRDDLREKLVDLLAEYKSEIGATVMTVALFDPPPRTENRAVPASRAVKAKILELIAQTGDFTQLSRLAEFVRAASTPPDLVVLAADAIRRVGLPQDARPGKHPDVADPETTAGQLHEIVARVNSSRIAPQVARRRDELLAELSARKGGGLTGDSYRLGTMELRPGDWMLMRNPSPYNLFTDISPGLFTHVGVVTMEKGSDGRRRMVVVDLPERGRQIPATNVEIYVRRSLHYAFLRHPDPDVAKKIADTAAEVIGNESEFDLNFRTDRVLPLKGQPLKGQKIKTYCAGLLVLTAQETPLPRERFFPIPEPVAGGNTAANLEKMGFSLGKDFISPTGALFSPELKIAARRPPMYDPMREIEEAVFDHFAQGVERKTYVPSRSLYQDLRLKLANIAKDNPALADAIRQGSNVGSTLDLVAGAKAQAVVETLDEIAYGHSREFTAAFLALTNENLDQLVGRDFTAEQVAEMKRLRQRHASLYQRVPNITPRQLRQELVSEYIRRGQGEIDRRFFGMMP
jgi:hypothetical protein